MQIHMINSSTQCIVRSARDDCFDLCANVVTYKHFFLPHEEGQSRGDLMMVIPRIERFGLWNVIV